MISSVQVEESGNCHFPGEVTLTITCSRNFANILGYLLQNRTTVGPSLERISSHLIQPNPQRCFFRFYPLPYAANYPLEKAQADLRAVLQELKTQEIFIPKDITSGI